MSAAALIASEDDLLAFVLDTARVFGWRTMHVRPARTVRGWRSPVQGDGKGFPDLLAIRGPRLVVAELKSAKGRLSGEQEEWLDDWRDIPGAEVFVWRPADLDAAIEVFSGSAAQGRVA